MGCICSTPSTKTHEPYFFTAHSSQHSASSAYCRHERSDLTAFVAPAAATAAGRDQSGATAGAAHASRLVSGASGLLSPHEIYDLAVQIFRRHPQFSAELDVLTPVCVAVVESHGAVCAVHYNEDIGEDRIGLCQMTLASARWLAARPGFGYYGSSLTRANLLDPSISLYFCTAYLLTLATRGDILENGVPLDLDEYRVRAYHAGPKSWRCDDTEPYWCRYQHAKHQLGRLHHAMHTPTGPTMHIVHSHETLPIIAAVCGVTVHDILAANPDIPHAGAIQACDCIVLPVTRIVPRLYIVQASDVNMTSIARSQGVSLARLLAKNPANWEAHLTPPPGWVLLLPGLRTKSEYLTDVAELDAGQRPGSSWYTALMAQQYNPMQYYQPPALPGHGSTAYSGTAAAPTYSSISMNSYMGQKEQQQHASLAVQEAYGVGTAHLDVQPLYRPAASAKPVPVPPGAVAPPSLTAVY